MPEPTLHIPLVAIGSERIFSMVIVKWFAFLNKRPQRGRDVHCENEVGTLRRDIEKYIASYCPGDETTFFDPFDPLGRKLGPKFLKLLYVDSLNQRNVLKNTRQIYVYGLIKDVE